MFTAKSVGFTVRFFSEQLVNFYIKDNKQFHEIKIPIIFF